MQNSAVLCRSVDMRLLRFSAYSYAVATGSGGCLSVATWPLTLTTILKSSKSVEYSVL